MPLYRKPKTVDVNSPTYNSFFEDFNLTSGVNPGTAFASPFLTLFSTPSNALNINKDNLALPNTTATGYYRFQLTNTGGSAISASFDLYTQRAKLANYSYLRTKVRFLGNLNSNGSNSDPAILFSFSNGHSNTIPSAIQDGISFYWGEYGGMTMSYRMSVPGQWAGSLSPASSSNFPGTMSTTRYNTAELIFDSAAGLTYNFLNEQTGVITTANWSRAQLNPIGPIGGAGDIAQRELAPRFTCLIPQYNFSGPPTATVFIDYFLQEYRVSYRT